MKKRYVRYRLVSESSIIERDRAQLVSIREDNERVWKKQGVENMNVHQLLGLAAKSIAGTVEDVTWLAYTVMKRMGGTIIMWIKEFIKQLPNIAARVFNFVKSLVGIFWNTFGKGFLNLLKGLAAICAAFFEGLANALNKTIGNSNGTTGGVGTTPDNSSGEKGKTDATLGNSSGEKGKTVKDFFSSFNQNPLSVLNLDKANANPKGKPMNNNYSPNFILSDRAIKILNEASNNPGMVRRTLDSMIEKAKPKFGKLCYRCIKGNVADKDPQLAGMIGASTILIYGNSRQLPQTGNPTNQQSGKKYQ